MRTITQVSIELADMYPDTPLGFDYSNSEDLNTLPDSPLKSEMLQLLGINTYNHTVDRLSRTECFKYLKLAKSVRPAQFDSNPTVQVCAEYQQSTGHKFNLARCSVPELRQIVLELYPNGLPEDTRRVAYRDMQDALRVAKYYGTTSVKIRLNASYQDMVQMMQDVFGNDWQSNLDAILGAVSTFTKAEHVIINQMRGLIKKNV